MTYLDLAILRSLAIRPSSNIPQCIQTEVIALLEAGYVVHSPDGWITTALGCSRVQQSARSIVDPGVTVVSGDVAPRSAITLKPSSA